MQHAVASVAAAAAAGVVYGVNWWRLRRQQPAVVEDEEKRMPVHHIFGGEYSALSPDFSGYIHLDEIHRRLVYDDERQLFHQCLAHLEEIMDIVRSHTLDKAVALQNVTYAYNHAEQMRQLFGKLATLAYSHDPSRTKRVAIRENASRAMDAVADMLAQIVYHAQELVRASALR
jgi:hypothetical protein